MCEASRLYARFGLCEAYRLADHRVHPTEIADRLIPILAATHKLRETRALVDSILISGFGTCRCAFLWMRP